jgi:outer membrane protein TolC
MGYLNKSSALLFFSLSSSLLGLPGQALAQVEQSHDLRQLNPETASAAAVLSSQGNSHRLESSAPARSELVQVVPVSLTPAVSQPSPSFFVEPPPISELEIREPDITELAVREPDRQASEISDLAVREPGLRDLAVREPGINEPKLHELGVPVARWQMSAVTDASETPGFSPSRSVKSREPGISKSETSEPEIHEPAVLEPASQTPPMVASDQVLTEADLPPEDLLADPNPLAFPTEPEEVTIEDTQVVTLEEAIELAYVNNPDLQVALLELERSQATLDEARAALAPTVSASSDLTFQERSSTTVLGLPVGDSSLDGRLNGALQVDYDIFTAGQRSATIRAAESQVRFSELEIERRQEVLRLTTANLYYALQDATEQIRINQAFLDEASRNLRDNRIRQEEGVGTRFDVLRAEVQFANARQALIQSQSQQRITQRDLARFLNLPTTLNIQATPVEKAGSWSLTLEESIVLAFQNRADLEQQLAQRELSEQQAIAARAALGPRVSLFANYSLSDILDADNFRDTYSFGARVNFTLFDGGAANARGRQQDRAAEIAEQRFAETLDQVRFDVEEAYFNLQANQENIDTARVAVNQAQEALRLANLRLDAGVGTQLDVLTAQSELTQAEGNLVTALLGYNRALAALQRAVSNLEATI